MLENEKKNNGRRLDKPFVCHILFGLIRFFTAGEEVGNSSALPVGVRGST